MVLEWTPEEATEPTPGSTFLCCSVSLHLKSSMGGSEPPAALLFHYMRHSTIDLSLLHLKRASETQNHLTFSYWVPEHQGTGCFMRSECIKLVLVSFTLISHIISCMLHLYCQSYIMFARGACAS